MTGDRVKVYNLNYGHLNTTGRKHRHELHFDKPWMVLQIRGGNRTFATFAEAVRFINGGSWS